MKKLFFFGFVIVAFWSCSIDDSVDEEFRSEFLPIESVTIPSEMHHGEVYTIDYTYFKPSTCHIFHDLYYISESNYHTLAVINTVLTNVENTICKPLTDELVERSFTFLCESSAGTYIFKFWQGVDENGQDIYLIHEVPIVN